MDSANIQIVNTNTALQNEEEDEDELYDEDMDESDSETVYSNQYKLVGIVVHSGQANGGHYYSFIQHKSNNPDQQSDEDPLKETDFENNSTNSSSSVSTSASSSYSNWYKFDDGEVSEFKMDDDEMRNQCYGGDYTGEVYDNIMKRMAYKKQKRWWNAYILFFERLKASETATGNKSFTNNNENQTGNSFTNECKNQTFSKV